MSRTLLRAQSFALLAIGPAAFAQTVRVTEEPVVSQPPPFSASGRTVVVPRTRVEVDEDVAPMPKPPNRPSITAAPAPEIVLPSAEKAEATIGGVYVRRGDPIVVILPDRITAAKLAVALKAHELTAEETASVLASARSSGKIRRP
ncbi:MAG: hypothetical protein EXQ91_03785 [Alphaproteobacteria bacterium]|nr:hypothetical protein [Alphaproteobacteria bacterium]